MVLIGFLLLTAAAVFGIDVVAQNQNTIDVEGFNQLVATSPAAVLVAGIVTGLCAAVGIMLMRDGMVRHHERRLARREVEEERDRLAAAAEHEQERRRFDLGAIESQPLDLREGERVTTF